MHVLCLQAEKMYEKRDPQKIGNYDSILNHICKNFICIAINRKKVSIFLLQFIQITHISFSEPVPYRTLTKRQNSQKLLDRNLQCIYIFIEQTSFYQNTVLFLISVELLSRNLASKLG